MQQALPEDPNAEIIVTEQTLPEETFDIPTTQTIAHVLSALPNGVQAMSQTVAGVVETSLSIGVLKTEEDEIKGTILLRSLIEGGTNDVKVELTELLQKSGGNVEYYGYYPGWAPQPDTEIVTLTKKHYTEILGYEPEIKVIHAGLECGLLKKIYPNLDVVSIGPTIRNAHSPDEKVHIPAVQTYWQLLTTVLANI